jgi:hypothetical protein
MQPMGAPAAAAGGAPPPAGAPVPDLAAILAQALQAGLAGEHWWCVLGLAEPLCKGLPINCNHLCPVGLSSASKCLTLMPDLHPWCRSRSGWCSRSPSTSPASARSPASSSSTCKHTAPPSSPPGPRCSSRHQQQHQGARPSPRLGAGPRPVVAARHTCSRCRGARGRVPSGAAGAGGVPRDASQ